MSFKKYISLTAVLFTFILSSLRAEDFAYVTNFAPNNVSVIDLSNNTVVATVTVGATPLGIAITPDGAFAYVTNASDDNVSVIDLSNNTAVATVAVGAGPFGIAICPSQVEELVVTAKTGRDRFLTQTDLFNRISWIPPEVSPTSYEVLLDETLLATLPGYINYFIDHNKRKDETSTYTILAFDGTDEVARGTITITCVKCQCHCNCKCHRSP